MEEGKIKEVNPKEIELEEVAPGVWVREIPRERRQLSREFVEEIATLSGSATFAMAVRRTLQVVNATDEKAK
jgi:hypothetical protein